MAFKRETMGVFGLFTDYISDFLNKIGSFWYLK